MNDFVERLRDDAMYFDRGHGAFGESERWRRLDEDKFAELIVAAVFDAIANERFEIPDFVINAVKEKFQDKE